MVKYVLTIASLFLISACAVKVVHFPQINFVDSCYFKCYDNYRSPSNSMCLFKNVETGELFNTRAECEHPNE